MASTAAFGTYELLEQVLLHLPVKDLLLSQRVAKGWRDLVQRSGRIRRALFLDDSFSTGTVLDEKTMLWHMTSRTAGDYEHALFPLINPILNTFFTKIQEGLRDKELLHDGLVAPRNASDPNARLNHHELARHTRMASWKRLHMFQPHLCKLRIYCAEGGAHYESCQLGSNLRSAEVIEGLRRHWYECPNCPLRPTNTTPFSDLNGDYNFKRLPSDITGWAVLGELQKLH